MGWGRRLERRPDGLLTRYVELRRLGVNQPTPPIVILTCNVAENSADICKKLQELALPLPLKLLSGCLQRNALRQQRTGIIPVTGR